MHAGDVRTLIRQAGLSYRAKEKFEALPELALPVSCSLSWQ